jgi:hypothetical protein
MDSDFRRFPDDKRQIINYNKFLELTGAKIFLCLDKGVMQIARYLLNTRGSWRTTYVKEYVGTIGYNMPTEAEFEAVLKAIAEANTDMSTCEDLTNVLGEIRDALFNMASGAGAGCGPCGGGSRGAGESEAPANPYESDGENYPSGFSSREQFDQVRCNRAHDIVDNLVSDLQGLAGIEYGVESSIPQLVTVLVTVLLTPIPYDDIAYLVALLLFTAIAYTYLVEFSSVVFDNRDDLACILYNAASSGEAQVEFRARLDELVVGTAYPDPAKAFVYDVVEHLTPLDAINLLYANTPTITQDGDCSECTDEDLIWSINTLICTPTQVSGTFIDGGEVELESCEGNYFGTTRAGINSGAQPDEELERHIVVTAVTGGGSFYVTTREGGIDVNDPKTAAELEGFAVDCSQMQVCRLDASDTTPFGFTITATLI